MNAAVNTYSKNNYIFIEVEELEYTNFSNKDVLDTEAQKFQRMSKIVSFQDKLKIYKPLVKIFFVDEYQPRLAIGNIWHIGKRHIVLQSGGIIPIHAIVDLDVILEVE